MARGLPAEQPFYVVHPHPLTDLPIPDTMAEMVTELMAAIRAVRPHGPYRLRRALQWSGSSPSRSRDASSPKATKWMRWSSSMPPREMPGIACVSRLARVLAWIGRLDGQAERQALPEPAGSRDGSRLGAGGMASPVRRPCRRPPRREILIWSRAPRAGRKASEWPSFRLVARAHVPGRYAGAVHCSSRAQRRSLRHRSVVVSGRRSRRGSLGPRGASDLDHEHGPELAERLRACLAGPSAALAP